jgi:fido (protein-threonine AMPylation protein)
MLKPDSTIRDHKTWEDFEEKGLCPEIKSLEDYRGNFSKNWEEVRKFLISKKGPIIKSTDFQELHGTLFNNIYPWAGTFRKHNIFCRGREGAAPENIPLELELLEAQMDILLREAENKLSINRIAAFQHARLTTIQAFGDGNSRSSRAVTDHFLYIQTGTPRQKEMDRTHYFDCLEAALGKENLAPLSSLFSEVYGEPPEKVAWIPSPFRTTNSPREISMPSAIEISFRQHPTFLNQPIPTKLAWTNKISWEKIVGVFEGLGATPTPNEPLCKSLWEESKKKQVDAEEAMKLLKRVENLTPFKFGFMNNLLPKNKGAIHKAWRKLELELIPYNLKKPHLGEPEHNI